MYRTLKYCAYLLSAREKQDTKQMDHAYRLRTLPYDLDL